MRFYQSKAAIKYFNR